MTVDLDSLQRAADAGGGAVLGNNRLKAVLAELRRGRAAMSELGRRDALDTAIDGLAA